MNKKFLCHFRSEGGSLLHFGFLFSNSPTRTHCSSAKNYQLQQNTHTHTHIINAASSLRVVYLWPILYMKIKYESKEVHQLPKHSHGHETHSFDNDDACTVPISTSSSSTTTMTTKSLLSSLGQVLCAADADAFSEQNAHTKSTALSAQLVKISQHLSLIFCMQKQNHRLLLVKRYGIS